MREQNWYVFLIGRYAYRIRCESYYIHQLYHDKAILSNLTTTNKSSLVDAINELNSNLPAGGIYDLDNPPEKMIFSAMAGSTNLPDDLGGANAVTVIRMKLGSSNFDAMIAFSFSADRIAIRRKGGTENWSKWKYFNAQ